MGTVIERVSLTDGGWRTRHSALRLAVKAAKHCLDEAGRSPHEVNLLINAGIIATAIWPNQHSRR